MPLCRDLGPSPCAFCGITYLLTYLVLLHVHVRTSTPSEKEIGRAIPGGRAACCAWPGFAGSSADATDPTRMRRMRLVEATRRYSNVPTRFAPQQRHPGTPTSSPPLATAVTLVCQIRPLSACVLR